MSGDVRTFVLLLPVLLVSMVLHELAHAWTAWRLGDPTARSLGRLSLNPIVHLEPLGTAMFALTYFGGGFIFGWARPVPVNANYFRSPQRGMAIVALAGPITNFVIALGVAWLLVHQGPELSDTARRVVYYSLLVNITLGVFNLLPIPPLDGSRVVGAAMDDRTYARWSALDQYGMIGLLLLFLVFNAQFNVLLRGMTNAVGRVVLALVGGDWNVV